MNPAEEGELAARQENAKVRCESVPAKRIALSLGDLEQVLKQVGLIEEGERFLHESFKVEAGNIITLTVLIGE